MTDSKPDDKKKNKKGARESGEINRSTLSPSTRRGNDSRPSKGPPPRKDKTRDKEKAKKRSQKMTKELGFNKAPGSKNMKKALSTCSATTDRLRAANRDREIAAVFKVQAPLSVQGPRPEELLTAPSRSSVSNKEKEHPFFSGVSFSGSVEDIFQRLLGKLRDLAPSLIFVGINNRATIRNFIR